jgi:hypothetical protein
MATRHVYASVADFNDFLRDAGSTTFASESALIISRKLAVLEAVSRDIDKWCNRSRFESGFGPRTGTNRYTPDGSAVLRLDDDLLTITSVSVTSEVGGSATTYADETDFYKHPFDTSPYRRLECHGDTANTVFYATLRGTSVVGKWGHSDERVTSSATASEAMDTSETGYDVSSGTAFSPGNTILADSEQMLVTSISTNTLTVVRAVNGTTAATHSSGISLDVYRYPREVVDATLRLALMRWRARDAGADSSDGGGSMPSVLPRTSERAILHSTIGHLRFLAVA